MLKFYQSESIISLSPSGSLRLKAESLPQELSAFEQYFYESPVKAFFHFTAEKIDLSEYPCLYFWQGITKKYLTKLCHLTHSIKVPHLTNQQYQDLLYQVPPFKGVEYLSLHNLYDFWNELNSWVENNIEKNQTLCDFLLQNAPKWQQVGRVCFHLAENKLDTFYPFAFLATFTVGFHSSGQIKHLPLRKALEKYVDEPSSLVKLLVPVQKASTQCFWIQEMLENKELYQAVKWSQKKAYQLLKDCQILEECGLSLRVPNWWKKRIQPQLHLKLGDDKESHFKASNLINFNASAALGDQQISDKELQQLLKGEEGLILFKGQWIEVKHAHIQEVLETLENLKTEGTELSFSEAMRLLAGASKDLDKESSFKECEWVHIQIADKLKETLIGLRNPSKLRSPNPGTSFTGTLRPYQKEGLAWLNFLTELGLGACLADDMGLGKTIQVLSLLLCHKRNNQSKPSLLVLPASLLSNWRKEAETFAPSLKLLFLHPSETKTKTLNDIQTYPEKHFSNSDLVVTTYSMLARQPFLKRQGWHCIILDEAQTIKNPSTKQTKAVKSLKAHTRIALTGTPIENHLGDLWSLFDFLNPGLLSSGSVFRSFVKSLQNSEESNFSPLRRLVTPYILRRMKTDRNIIKDLPDKSEVLCYCYLSKEQIKLYQQTVDHLEKSLQSYEDIDRKGLILSSLMRLKQICNHPSQGNKEGTFSPSLSGKFERLKLLCQEISDRQEKVLIFTQFREIIEPLAAFLETVFQRPGLILHGGTSIKKRQDIVQSFQKEEGPPFFILSLKAGGTGLNLTEASHVIHFDRWWNPAVENQATDRAFRIGQKKNVLVHKFVTKGTLEEKIDEMIEAKKRLSQEVLSTSNEVNITELKDDELLDLLRLDIQEAMIGE